jgi:Domain of unknown function (DUF6908)
MRAILRILERAGGYRPTLYLQVENPPYMALVIEAVLGHGPLGCRLQANALTDRFRPKSRLLGSIRQECLTAV